MECFQNEVEVVVAVPAFRRERQEDWSFILDSVVSFRPIWHSVSKRKKKKVS